MITLWRLIEKSPSFACRASLKLESTLAIYDVSLA